MTATRSDLNPGVRRRGGRRLRAAGCAMLPWFVLLPVMALAQVVWEPTPGAVLDVGGPESWDAESVYIESLLVLPEGPRLWYRGTNDPAATVDWQIGCAGSSDFVLWQKTSPEPCFLFGVSDRWDDLSFGASVTFEPESGLFKMWYGGAEERTPFEFRIGHATSPDGVTWRRVGVAPVLSPQALWERTAVDSPRVLRLGDVYHMWYTGRDFGVRSTWQIGYATSPNGVDWTRYEGNPVLSGGGPGEPEAVYIPNVLADPATGLLEMWFVHRTATRIGLGYALSLDGVVWTEYEGNPLALTTLLPVRGALTGAVARQGNTYHMVYNGWWGGEIYRGHHATAAWTLPRPVFEVAILGDCALVDAAGSTSPTMIAGYRWDFGDGTVLEDAGPCVEHVYSPGTYRLELRVSDETGERAAVARDVVVAAAVGPFVRGDCDGDGRATGSVTDAVFLLTFSFFGGPSPVCAAACDADGDGRFGGQVTDAIFLLAHSFLGGPPPPPPFPECGTSSRPEDRELACPVPGACP
jgi:hypothetical protein